MYQRGQYSGRSQQCSAYQLVLPDHDIKPKLAQRFFYYRFRERENLNLKGSSILIDLSSLV